MATIRIQTAQNVTLEYEIAGPGERIVATLIDYALYAAWFLLCLWLASNFLGLVGESAYWLAVLPTVFYFLACEVFFNGQTLGKKARHLRVMRLDGTAPTLGNYLLRWLLRPIEIVYTLGSVALVAVLVSRHGQRLGDLAAGTTVVSLKARPQHTAPAFTPLEGYQPVFPQAAVLTDQDAALIRKLANQANRSGNFQLMNEIANRVKVVTSIQTELADIPFLQTILRDHAHLAVAQEQ